MGITNLNKFSKGNFILTFPRIPTQETKDESSTISLNIYQTVMPAITLDTSDLYWQGGTGHTYAGNISYEPWFVHFFVDSRFRNWTMLLRWIQSIHNNKDRYGRAPKEFQVDASVSLLDNTKKQIGNVVLHNAWPNFLGEIELTYQDETTYLTSVTNIIYDRYDIQLF